MSRDPGLEDTAAPEDPGSAATLAREGAQTDEGSRSPTEAWLRARIEARLFGGQHARIGRFEVLGAIGAGGMSVVCRARDPDLDREVAIKLLRGGEALGDQGRARLQREARAMAKLAHPNVATVFEVGVHEGEVFVAMELVPGETLRAWCTTHADEPVAILAVYLAAGEGLAAAHAAGFVHRDFKPDNVIVGTDGRPRVLDFGLAAVMGESIQQHSEAAPSGGDAQGVLTLTGSVLGTPAYMAPEQHRGGVSDERTDQFAFCVSLWEALGGARPFAGGSLGELARAVSAGAIVAPSRAIASPVEVVLRRGLAVEPGDRFASMRALLDALAGARPGRPARRWPLPAAIVGALALVGTIFFVFAKREEVPAEPPVRVTVADAVPSPSDTPLPTVQLTRTSGRGIDATSLFMDAEAERIVYRAGNQRWMRRIADATPELLEWAHPELEPLAFDAAGEGWIADDDEWLWRIRDGVAPERLPFAARPAESQQQLAPDGRALLRFDEDSVVIERVGATPVSTLARRMVAFGGWAPDGRRWAAVVMSDDREHAELLVLDLEGAIEHRTDFVLESDGLAWTDDHHIAVIDLRDESPSLVCFEVGEDAIAAPTRRALELPAGATAQVVQGSRTGAVLMITAKLFRDVGVLALDAEEPPKLRPLSEELEASNLLPVWLGDTRLAFVTDRFGGSSVMLDERAGGAARPEPRIEGRVIACAALGDGLLCAVADAGDEHWFVRTSGTAAAQRIGPAPRRLVGLECTAASQCFALVAGDDGHEELHALDPAHGTLVRRFACPAELHCASERWAPAPDGRSLLFVDGTHVRRLDAMSGAELDGDVIGTPAGSFVQSAVELAGGDIVSTQMVSEGAATIYRVVRTQGKTSRTIWQSSDVWVVRPRPSPNERDLALTTMRFHLEATLAANACAPG